MSTAPIMNAIDAMKYRRTVRVYDQEWTCPSDVLETIVAAGLDAPTACNFQGIDLVVVTDKKRVDAITQRAFDGWPESTQKEFLARQKTYGVKNVVSCDAPVLILLVRNERADPTFSNIDTGIITEALLVAIASYGLDSMCLGSLLWGNVAGVEEEAGIKKGSLSMGIVFGKSFEDRKLGPKERLCKATYIN